MEAFYDVAQVLVFAGKEGTISFPDSSDSESSSGTSSADEDHGPRRVRFTEETTASFELLDAVSSGVEAEIETGLAFGRIFMPGLE